MNSYVQLAHAALERESKFYPGPDAAHLTPGPWQSIAQIKAANAVVGGYWFSAATMKFFRSRISPTIYAGRFFVHRISDGEGYTRYKVAYADNIGRVESIGDAARTHAEAKAFARALAAAIG